VVAILIPLLAEREGGKEEREEKGRKNQNSTQACGHCSHWAPVYGRGRKEKERKNTRSIIKRYILGQLIRKQEVGKEGKGKEKAPGRGAFDYVINLSQILAKKKGKDINPDWSFTMAGERKGGMFTTTYCCICSSNSISFMERKGEERRVSISLIMSTI